MDEKHFQLALASLSDDLIEENVALDQNSDHKTSIGARQLRPSGIAVYQLRLGPAEVPTYSSYIAYPRS